MSKKVYDVVMLAIGVLGEVRKVEIELDDNVCDVVRLEEIFLQGQNEVQPMDYPSVSRGDVIIMEDNFYLVCSVGFYKLTKEEYTTYYDMSKYDRMIRSFKYTPNI